MVEDVDRRLALAQNAVKRSVLATAAPSGAFRTSEGLQVTEDDVSTTPENVSGGARTLAVARAAPCWTGTTPHPVAPPSFPGEPSEGGLPGSAFPQPVEGRGLISIEKKSAGSAPRSGRPAEGKHITLNIDGATAVIFAQSAQGSNGTRVRFGGVVLTCTAHGPAS